MRQLWCIVLAAGGSRRYGRPKQLLHVGDRPMLLNAVNTACAVAPGRVVVVLGARFARYSVLLRRARTDARIAHNPRWRSGMAGSLRTGLRALPARAAAALVLLADQPLVDRAALTRLIRSWSAAPRAAAAARYLGKTGVPAILPRALWPAARRLHGDTGARALLRQRLPVSVVDMPEAAVDIDTSADAAALGATICDPAWRSSPIRKRR